MGIYRWKKQFLSSWVNKYYPERLSDLAEVMCLEAVLWDSLIPSITLSSSFFKAYLFTLPTPRRLITSSLMLLLNYHCAVLLHLCAHHWPVERLEHGTCLYFLLNLCKFPLGADTTIACVDGIVCVATVEIEKICNCGGLAHCFQWFHGSVIWRLKKV